MCSLTGSPSSDTWRTNPFYSPNSISLRDTHCCSVTKLYQTLKPCGLQHARLPSLLLSPADCSSSCLLSRWCHPTISSSVTPFPSWPQSFPASKSFPMSQLFSSGAQRMGASGSVLKGLMECVLQWNSHCIYGCEHTHTQCVCPVHTSVLAI